MEFLKIYDVTEAFKETSLGDSYDKYFVQMDTHDFHVFRIFEGNYDDENESGYGDDPSSGYTVERENIDKNEVLESMGIGWSSRAGRDSIYAKMDFEKIIRGVIGADEQLGFSNYDFKVYGSIDDCIEYAITEKGNWEMIYVYMELSKEQLNILEKIGDAQLESQSNDNDEISFVYNDKKVVHPLYDETGTYSVDPIEYYGDSILESGFMELIKHMPYTMSTGITG